MEKNEQTREMLCKINTQEKQAVALKVSVRMANIFKTQHDVEKGDDDVYLKSL